MGNVKNNNLKSNNLRSAWLSDGDTIASKPSRPRLYRPRKRLGRCYELAYNYLHKDDRFVRWRLVHGEIGEGRLAIGHAWLKRGALIYDPVLDEFFHAWSYRERFDAVALESFTMSDCLKWIGVHGTYGPWNYRVRIADKSGGNCWYEPETRMKDRYDPSRYV